ncbi:MAG TPA: 6-phosphofructokinase, partial [Polyangiaceae bacterium LLY-WYZ-15_(1-7)]|nr:6-phosphofructokinase [Polyangiaceae bacterium LLY-WYZ-15_(1-7)]
AEMMRTDHCELRVVGLPASIDNDIGCTGLSIGVDTALNTIIEACDRIADTARAHRRAFIVEVMGRECGYLAMAAAIAAGADAVLMREQGRDERAVVEAVEKTVRAGFDRGKKRVLVIKSEGVRVPCTKLVRELNARIPGDHVRATVLGHVVRGGAPSYMDRRIASRLAFQAVRAFEEGQTGTMTAWRATAEGGSKTVDPTVRLFPLAQVLEETRAVLDGTSAVMRWRLEMMERVAGVLGV